MAITIETKDSWKEQLDLMVQRLKDPSAKELFIKEVEGITYTKEDKEDFRRKFDLFDRVSGGRLSDILHRQKVKGFEDEGLKKNHPTSDEKGDTAYFVEVFTEIEALKDVMLSFMWFETSLYFDTMDETFVYSGEHGRTFLVGKFTTKTSGNNFSGFMRLWLDCLFDPDSTDDLEVLSEWVRKSFVTRAQNTYKRMMKWAVEGYVSEEALEKGEAILDYINPNELMDVYYMRLINGYRFDDEKRKQLYMELFEHRPDQPYHLMTDDRYSFYANHFDEMVESKRGNEEWINRFIFGSTTVDLDAFMDGMTNQMKGYDRNRYQFFARFVGYLSEPVQDELFQRVILKLRDLVDNQDHDSTYSWSANNPDWRSIVKNIIRSLYTKERMDKTGVQFYTKSILPGFHYMVSELNLLEDEKEIRRVLEKINLNDGANILFSSMFAKQTIENVLTVAAEDAWIKEYYKLIISNEDLLRIRDYHLLVNQDTTTFLDDHYSGNLADPMIFHQTRKSDFYYLSN